MRSPKAWRSGRSPPPISTPPTPTFSPTHRSPPGNTGQGLDRWYVGDESIAGPLEVRSRAYQERGGAGRRLDADRRLARWHDRPPRLGRRQQQRRRRGSATAFRRLLSAGDPGTGGVCARADRQGRQRRARDRRRGGASLSPDPRPQFVFRRHARPVTSSRSRKPNSLPSGASVSAPTPILTPAAGSPIGISAPSAPGAPATSACWKTCTAIVGSLYELRAPFRAAIGPTLLAVAGYDSKATTQWAAGVGPSLLVLFLAGRRQIPLLRRRGDGAGRLYLQRRSRPTPARLARHHQRDVLRLQHTVR